MPNISIDFNLVRSPPLADWELFAIAFFWFAYIIAWLRWTIDPNAKLKSNWRYWTWKEKTYIRLGIKFNAYEQIHSLPEVKELVRIQHDILGIKLYDRRYTSKVKQEVEKYSLKCEVVYYA